MQKTEQAQAKGTTSACAENTCHLNFDESFTANYLRVCGEYGPVEVLWLTGNELPPRVRRILVSDFSGMPTERTTSACAENTDGLEMVQRPDMNYLRVCGEYPK